MISLNTTHQQTKSLVDPVAGTYQTVLTIDLSVSQSDILGTYSCTVENARGRSSRMVVVGELTLYTCCCYLQYINNDSHPTPSFLVSAHTMCEGTQFALPLLQQIRQKVTDVNLHFCYPWLLLLYHTSYQLHTNCIQLEGRYLS